MSEYGAVARRPHHHSYQYKPLSINITVLLMFWVSSLFAALKPCSHAQIPQEMQKAERRKLNNDRLR
ncbi:hypothetical protein CEV32_0532 [Brucella rhizosphaerae]|uniref:Uncharacterized protein n=1 Tax=Brucella rhizosphaerae TaxID=571254 RepID=A0A256FI46_9HYPH|nr:hypothetical protein CEV32_0532 [Brucella rhizosphaerae]